MQLYDKFQILITIKLLSVKLEEVRQQDLLLALRENRDALSAMPTIWPVVGFVSSSFGWRSSPFGGDRKSVV